MQAQLRDFAASLDRVFYAIYDRATDEAVGVVPYLDIQPASGVIEIGGIWFAPGFTRSRGATEALFLMLAYAMDDLGYRSNAAGGIGQRCGLPGHPCGTDQA